MEKLPKWFLTGGLHASYDAESSTAMEMTYKLYQAVNNLIDEYNNFVDLYNSEWSQFEEKYTNDLEVFTLAMRQEFQDFIDVVDTKLAGVDYFEEEIANIKAILQTNDVNLDTLQELVDSLKNNVNSVEEIFTELNKKANKSELDAKQDKLVAGEGIKIEGNVIKSTVTPGGSGGSETSNKLKLVAELPLTCDGDGELYYYNNFEFEVGKLYQINIKGPEVGRLSFLTYCDIPDSVVSPIIYDFDSTYLYYCIVSVGCLEIYDKDGNFSDHIGNGTLSIYELPFSL